MKTKILAFNWRDIRNPEAGGAEVNVHEQAKRWVALGNSVTLFTARPSGQQRRETVDGIEIFRAGGRYDVYPAACFVYLTRLRKQADVVLDIENGIPFFTPLFSRKPRALLMHHLHQEQFLVEMGPIIGRIGRFLERFVVPVLYRNSKWISVSESTAHQKREALFHGPQRNIEVVYNGLDHDLYFPMDSKFSRPTVLYLGRIKEYKRLDILIDAMDRIIEKVPEAELIIAGTGDALERLRETAARARSRDSIRMLGFVDDAQKIELLRRSWVMATPSMNEGWGVTVIEANACGTPAVAFRVAGLDESIVSGVTGTLAESETTFSDAISEILIDKELRSRLSEHAIAWSRRFSWDETAARTLAILDEAVRDKVDRGSKKLPCRNKRTVGPEGIEKRMPDA